jgi:phosphoribosylaminoimidazole-succinocarboxamide synthase
MALVYETQLPLPLHARGKVRDTYALGDALLMIATDRLSAFDVVLPTPIPDKGRMLDATQRLLVPQVRVVDAAPPHQRGVGGYCRRADGKWG